MSEPLKAILATVTIVACLTLIGVMAYLKVEGAGIAAVSVVGVIIAWLTRTPDRKDPPIAPKLVPLLAASALLTTILACGCGAAERAAASQAEAEFRAQNLACKRQYAVVAQQDACREKVAESWGVTYTPRAKDGGL